MLLENLEEWQKQSALLLRARPSTTRVTTKYSIPNLTSSKYSKALTKSAEKKEEPVPRATLTLKTFDTASGVVLRYKTHRAQDVGRIIAGLGTLGRHMAALPEKPEGQDVTMTNTEDIESTSAAKAPPPTQQNNNPASGKKKKRGKK